MKAAASACMHTRADVLGEHLPDLTFRKLRSYEFDLAHSILVSAAAWLTARGIRQWTIAYPKELYFACQEKGWNYALESNGELAAIVTLSWEAPAEWADHFGSTPVWWLSKLATAPAFRGLGLGAFAVRHAIHAVSDRNTDRIYLDCVHGNGFLVDFYHRQGFQTIDRRPVRFSTGLFDMVLMELRISRTHTSSAIL
jgi:GNAT superfamily N-acetyltransferase